MTLPDPAGPPPEPSAQADPHTIPQLVAEVYQDAPGPERAHLLEHLLRPLGVLSLVVIADGVFAKIRFRSGWNHLNVRLEDLQGVQFAHVVSLVDHAQQVSLEVVDGLSQWLAASPVLSGSAAAAMLIAVLVKRARAVQAAQAVTDDKDMGPPRP